MTRGWIPAHRKIYEPGHWLAPTKRDPSNRRDAWLDLCQMATHTERETANSGTLERGEIVVSVRTMAERWCWSKSRVSRFMSDLEARTAIGTVRGTPDGTVYRIVNYDTYAVGTKGDRDTQRDDERDRNGTATGQEQEQENKTSNRYTSDFEALWSLSRRGSKKRSFAHYKKALKKTDHETLLEQRRAHVSAASDDRFVKHLDLWLRDERWEEEVPSPNGQRQDTPIRGFYRR